METTTLIEPRLWVVDVKSGAKTIEPRNLKSDFKTGEIIDEPTERERAATMITVAVEPTVAFSIINSLGAKGLNAWVSLAANDLASLPAATVAPKEAGPTPDWVGTLEALGPDLVPTKALKMGIIGYGGSAGK